MSSTPRYGHEPIKMRRRYSSENLEKVGDFKWHLGGGKRTLEVIIPDHCGQKQCWSRWTINHTNASGDSWTWNDDENKPTLQPSLHAVGTWHGFVRDGKLVEA